MAKIIRGSTPKQDGFYMPGEFTPQEKVWMIWPERTDNWRLGGKPVQEAYANVAKAISEFTPVTMLVSYGQYSNCRSRLPENIRRMRLCAVSHYLGIRLLLGLFEPFLSFLQFLHNPILQDLLFPFERHRSAFAVSVLMFWVYKSEG